MRIVIPTLCALAAATATLAEQTVEQNCSAAVAENAEDARDAAARWISLGGGVPARLCEAEALVALGANRLAAVKLTVLATAQQFAMETPLRAEILTDATRLWLTLGEAKLAEETASLAASLSGSKRDALPLLANALAAQDRWEEVDAIVSLLVEERPGPALFALGARANRSLGAPEAALSYADAALTMDAEHAEALFERASALQILGDVDAARQTATTFLQIHPRHPQANAITGILFGEAR